MSFDRKKPPSTRGSVGKQVENLVCLDTVDIMLLEGTPAADVVKFIQKDQGELAEVNEKTLVNALIARRAQRQEVDGYFGAGAARVDINDLDDSMNEVPRLGTYRRPSQTPSTLTRKLYEKSESKIKHLMELEGLYGASKDRIDRWMELESEVGAFSDRLGGEIVNAAKILEQHFAVAQDLGLIEGSGGSRLTLDIRHYSKGTAEVLSNPESRHRVISIVERLAQHAKREGREIIDAEAEPISLPMPKASGDDE